MIKFDRNVPIDTKNRKLMYQKMRCGSRQIVAGQAELLSGWGNIMPMAPVPIGARGERKLLVTADYAVDFLGLEAARVLGTPHLIAQLELTAREAVREHLDPGYDTVGTEVALRHFAATPLGMSVAFHAEVIEVAERRIRYRVWAVDEKEKVAEGTHERAIVNVERFGQRVHAKYGGE